MFERILDTVLQGNIDASVANLQLLKVLFDAPGRSDAELDKLVDYFADEGTPEVIHGYARPGTPMPVYSIVLQSGTQENFYIGDDALHSVEGVAEFMAKMKEITGKDIDPGVQRWRYTYGIYTFSENPDVVIAYHSLVRRSMLEATMTLLEEGAEEPIFAEQDLQPFPKYLPDHVYGRVFTVTLSAHIFFALNLDLGPLAVGRGTSIRGAHISNNVTGVDGHIDSVES